MICSATELGLGDDHDGIIVLPRRRGASPATTRSTCSHLRDDVIEFEINPDRAYALSLRGDRPRGGAGLRRAVPRPGRAATTPAPNGDGYPVRVEAPDGCPVFVTRTVTGFDPTAPTPRLAGAARAAGRDAADLAGRRRHQLRDARARPADPRLRRRPAAAGRSWSAGRAQGEKLTTLDDVDRALSTEDLLITDDSGPIGLAGVMGGETTELSATTTPRGHRGRALRRRSTIFRTARRHKLPSEASKRFERGVDPLLPACAADRVAELLVELRRRHASTDGVTEVGDAADAADRSTIDADLPARITGHADRRRDRRATTCAPSAARSTSRRRPRSPSPPPPWRPDLDRPLRPRRGGRPDRRLRRRAVGAARRPRPARGLTRAQRLRRRVGRALAGAGCVEVMTYPFVGDGRLRRARAARRRRAAPHRAAGQPAVREEPLLHHHAAARPARGRAPATSAAAPPTWRSSRPRTVAFPTPAAAAPILRRRPAARPTTSSPTLLDGACPTSRCTSPWCWPASASAAGWWGAGRPAAWADAVERGPRGRRRARRRRRGRQAAQRTPWHPGRCARLCRRRRGARPRRRAAPAGLRGVRRSRPRTVRGRDRPRLPDRRGAATSSPAPAFSTLPGGQGGRRPGRRRRRAAPPRWRPRCARARARCCESVRLFDVYTGAQVGAGRKSLAFALRFRAPDRTLTEAGDRRRPRRRGRAAPPSGTGPSRRAGERRPAPRRCSTGCAGTATRSPGSAAHALLAALALARRARSASATWSTRSGPTTSRPTRPRRCRWWSPAPGRGPRRTRSCAPAAATGSASRADEVDALRAAPALVVGARGAAAGDPTWRGRPASRRAGDRRSRGSAATARSADCVAAAERGPRRAPGGCSAARCSALGDHARGAAAARARSATPRRRGSRSPALLRSRGRRARGPGRAATATRRTRARLRDRLGVDPGPRLRRVHAELLARDSPVRAGLRYDATSLVGRDDDIRALRALLRASRVVSIVGPGGLGKTRLAHLLGRAAEQPVVHFVELVGVTSPEGVVGEVGSALGVRDSVGGRRVLTPEQRTDVRARIAAAARPGADPADPRQLRARRRGGRRPGRLPGGAAPASCACSPRPARRSASPPSGSSRSPSSATTTRPSCSASAPRAARPGVALDEDEVAALVAPARRAAAGDRARRGQGAGRCRSADIDRRLDDRFALLRGGDRTRARPAPDAARGHRLVVEPARPSASGAALRWLSVFHDGFSLDGRRRRARSTTPLDVGAPARRPVAAGRVARRDGVRYRMLETVREFGRHAAGRRRRGRARPRAQLAPGPSGCARRIGAGCLGPDQVEAVDARARSRRTTSPTCCARRSPRPTRPRWRRCSRRWPASGRSRASTHGDRPRRRAVARRCWLDAARRSRRSTDARRGRARRADHQRDDLRRRRRRAGALDRLRALGAGARDPPDARRWCRVLLDVGRRRRRRRSTGSTSCAATTRTRRSPGWPCCGQPGHENTGDLAGAIEAAPSARSRCATTPTVRGRGRCLQPARAAWRTSSATAARGRATPARRCRCWRRSAPTRTPSSCAALLALAALRDGPARRGRADARPRSPPASTPTGLRRSARRRSAGRAELALARGEVDAGLRLYRECRRRSRATAGIPGIDVPAARSRGSCSREASAWSRTPCTAGATPAPTSPSDLRAGLPQALDADDPFVDYPVCGWRCSRSAPGASRGGAGSPRRRAAARARRPVRLQPHAARRWPGDAGRARPSASRPALPAGSQAEYGGRRGRRPAPSRRPRGPLARGWLDAVARRRSTSCGCRTRTAAARRPRRRRRSRAAPSRPAR